MTAMVSVQPSAVTSSIGGNLRIKRGQFLELSPVQPGRSLRSGGQAAWKDRFARPIQKPSMGWSGACSGSPAAPSVTNIGAKCSMVGCAYGMPGARLRKSASSSTAPRARVSAVHASNSRDQPGAGASGRQSRRNGRPCVVKPEPDDQHALVAQRGEPAAQLEQPVRLQGRQRHLQHRDVGVRVHHGQRHVRPVVEAAGGAGDVLVVGHQLLDPGRPARVRRARGYCTS